MFPQTRIQRCLLSILLLLPLLSAQAQKKRHFQVENLVVGWQLESNHNQGKDETLAYFSFYNKGKVPFPAGGWSIFFNSNRPLVPGSCSANAEITHVNGDLFRIRPLPEFHALENRQGTAVQYAQEDVVLNRTVMPSGLYLVWDDQPDKAYAITQYLATAVKPSILPNMSPEDRFERFEYTSCVSEQELVKIFPTPQICFETGGTFLLNNGVQLHYEKEFSKEADYLSIEIERLCNRKKVPVNETYIRLKKLKNMPPEAYSMVVSHDSIVISAGSNAGIFYGIQSLRTLIPPQQFAGGQSSIEIPCVRVSDQPRFVYRSLLIDVARNFRTKAEMFKIIDLMALYKLNHLHLHFVTTKVGASKFPDCRN
jgi:hexosaminidase